MSSSQKSIRCVALGIVLHQGNLLVQVVQTHPTPIYRPLGGQIEFGEDAESTIIREFSEELDWEISVISKLGWIENIFQHNNEIGHELACLFHIKSKNLPQKQTTWGFLENDGILQRKTATWIPLEQFIKGNAKLVPSGALQFLILAKITEVSKNHDN